MPRRAIFEAVGYIMVLAAVIAAAQTFMEPSGTGQTARPEQTVDVHVSEDVSSP